jgi:hypothetical protein
MPLHSGLSGSAVAFKRQYYTDHFQGDGMLPVHLLLRTEQPGLYPFKVLHYGPLLFHGYVSPLCVTITKYPRLDTLCVYLFTCLLQYWGLN